MATVVEVTPAVEPIRSELSTYCLVKQVNDKGEETIAFMTEKAATKLAEEKKGEIVASQSWKGYNAETVEGMAQLVPSEKERTKLFNRGADQKQYQAIRAAMLETDSDGNYTFQPKEEAIDLAAILAEESASRASNPEAKVEKILDNVGDSAAQIALMEKLLAKLKGVSASA